MPVSLALVVFFIALGSTLLASELMVRGVGWLGVRLQLSGGLVGLLIALGANTPEIGSSISALAVGAKEVGVGIIVGSNLFNLAALLGLTALVANGLSFRRILALVHGGVGILVLAVVAITLLGKVGSIASAVLLLLLVVPYAAILATPPARLRRLPLPMATRRSLAWLAAKVRVRPERAREVDRTSWAPAWMVLPALITIGIASYGLVISALALSNRWLLPHRFVGTVILAVLTSLPNTYAAIRLGRQRYGSAVVSEAFNSNTINLIAGIGLPALVLGGTLASGRSSNDLWWLLALTIVAMGLALPRAGIGRLGGSLLIAAYLVYLALQMSQGWT